MPNRRIVYRPSLMRLAWLPVVSLAGFVNVIANGTSSPIDLLGWVGGPVAILTIAVPGRYKIEILDSQVRLRKIGRWMSFESGESTITKVEPPVKIHRPIQLYQISTEGMKPQVVPLQMFAADQRENLLADLRRVLDA